MQHSEKFQKPARRLVFGRAPLDGEGALPVHWRKPIHMDAWSPPGTFSEGVQRAVRRGNSEVIRRPFGGNSDTLEGMRVFGPILRCGSSYEARIAASAQVTHL